MKSMYKQNTEFLSSRQNRYDGLKSLLYFLLMVAILCSMLFMPDKIHAADGTIQFGVQITESNSLSGTVSGRFLKDFDASDLYIIAYPESEPFSMDNLFSLTLVNNNQKEMVWKNQIEMISTYSCIKAGGWSSLSSIDFTPLKDQDSGVIPDLVLVLLLVKQGGDPLDPSNWYGSAATTLLTDPSKRVPGQTLFVTDMSSNSYYQEDAADTESDPSVTEDSDKDDDESEVEKPDIYKISGNRLFYANGSASRFQVVDISHPETPLLIYSESLQSTPLDLFIHNDYVILLEQMSERDDISVVLKVFHLNGDLIQKVAEQAYTDMQYSASRKSGDRIFITGTTPSYYPYGVDIISDAKSGEDSADVGSSVVAIDISTPASPLLISQKKLEGYDSDIYLNGDYLVQISRVSWDTTTLNLFDLNQSDPLIIKDQIQIPGRVPSEYHVNISDNTLFVIYRDQDISKGSFLKIFEIHSGGATEKDAVEEKGSVDGIAPGEELFAATFMDSKAYVVTYERKDPLWVIDTSDHSAPRIIGELEVPGWSEYIRFNRERLIALGYDDSDGKQRVSVALFSVEDPLKPLLLDRVTPLSGISDYTSSIAIDDDRGFYLNSSSGLIMVPISYYTDGNCSGLEIIQLDSTWDSFEKANFVQASFNVQRGTESDDSGNIVVSMGDAALNTIDISSGDKPVILGNLRLAYNVEKIAPYEDEATQKIRSIFALGGDFYTNGTSDLMSYESEDGEWNFTAPEKITDSELLYPELLLNRAGFGVIFSSSSSAFRLFDQENMEMGNIVKLGDISNWSISAPIVSNNHLYFAVSQYSYIDESGIEASYSLNTTLKRYDCSEMNSPEQLPDISIPGTPKALFNNTRLISVESYIYYYPAEYLYELNASENREESGTRINAIELGLNSGVLDRTAFFDQESYGYSSVICDESAIYLVAIKDEQTDIHKIDPVTLNITNTYSVKGSFSPVTARKSRILISSGGYYPYWRYLYDFIPYWNSNEIKVIDVSGETLQETTAFSSDLYPSQSNTVMTDNGLYIANGYRGVVYFPLN